MSWKGWVNMRDKFIFNVDKDEAFSTIFWAYVRDHNLPYKTDDDMRLAIATVSHAFQNSLMEYFNVEPVERW